MFINAYHTYLHSLLQQSNMIQSVLVSERPDASLRRRRVAEEYTPLHKACKVSHPSSLPPSLSSFFSFSPSLTCSLHPPKSPLPTTILSFSATLHTSHLCRMAMWLHCGTCSMVPTCWIWRSPPWEPRPTPLSSSPS